MCAEDTFRLNTGMYVITGDSLLGCMSSVGQSDSGGDYSDCSMATLKGHTKFNSIQFLYQYVSPPALIHNI